MSVETGPRFSSERPADMSSDEAWATLIFEQIERDMALVMMGYRLLGKERQPGGVLHGELVP